MSIVAEVLGPHLKQSIVSFEKGLRKDRKTLRSTVSAAKEDQGKHGEDAWYCVGNFATDVADDAILLWHKNSKRFRVRSVYAEASTLFVELLKTFDFDEPVETCENIDYQPETYVKKRQRQLKDRFIRIDDTEEGRFLRYLELILPDRRHAESALVCSLIAGDWDTAAHIASNFPTAIRPKSGKIDTFDLLRLVVLNDTKRVHKFAPFLKSHRFTVDFPPIKSDFALAAVDLDAKLMRKAIRELGKTYSNKWNVDKLITPKWLRRYGGSRERLFQAIRRDLLGYKWLYSSWSLALVSIAVHRSVPIETSWGSEFVPVDLVQPAG